MRHVILLDFRSEVDFNQSHIRKSSRVTLETYKDELMTAMLSQDKTVQAKYKSQYDNDDLKRVVFIFPMPSYRKFETHIKEELDSINTQISEKSGKLVSLHKAFFLKEFDTIFEGKYPLLCVQENSSEKRHVQS